MHTGREIRMCTLKLEWVYNIWPCAETEKVVRVTALVVTGDVEAWVNIGSWYTLLPDGTKPLPEPMLISHKWCPVTITFDQLHSGCPGTILYYAFEN